ncbi:MAG: hypothetical protein ACRD0Y_03405, partial [Terriglobales bacterium]
LAGAAGGDGQEYLRCGGHGGAHDSSGRLAGQTLAGTSGDQVFLGPSVLLIHKDIGLSAGVQ